ncbi:MAG TPA: hypothetical protein VMB74_09340 [Streptosporangiaceae bacterium]|nr:hypothetical protein [Streptosporangiaceae bacterium]
MVIAAADARSCGPVWVAVVHPGTLRLTVPTSGERDAGGAAGGWEPGLILEQPAAAQTMTMVAAAKPAALGVMNF